MVLAWAVTTSTPLGINLLATCYTDQELVKEASKYSLGVVLNCLHAIVSLVSLWCSVRDVMCQHILSEGRAFGQACVDMRNHVVESHHPVRRYEIVFHFTAKCQDVCLVCEDVQTNIELIEKDFFLSHRQLNIAGIQPVFEVLEVRGR